MTAQDELTRRISRDSICRAVQKKIDAGTADFTDTARYCDRAAELLGMVLAAYVPNMPPEARETLCKALLRQRYLDTNAMLNAVQKTLDDAQGLHLAPQIADYPEERVEQAAHALADETVPVETIVRRAKSAPATIARSYHDDYIQKNAAFRSSAGLKCYITRIAAGGCCKWCTAMAGRYRYGEEPDDIYRRHDNCSCTVTYENGRKRQDVWSKREWEAPGKDAGAEKPTVFSQEQAAQIEAKALDGLTKPGHGDIMNLLIDEFVPCLRDSETGEILQTEAARVPRKQLSSFTEANGWGLDWVDRPKDEYIMGVYLKGDTTPQGLISLRKDKGGIYMSFACTAPHNNKQLNNGHQKYIGVGGHLFAIAIQESLKAGNGGCVYGFAANRELLQHYVKKLGAEHLPIQHPYQIIIEGEAAQKILDTYNFERRKRNGGTDYRS